jgi:hypothetical protein
VLHRLSAKGAPIGIDAGSLNEYDLYLRTVAGFEPIFADDSFTVYRNSDVQ